MSISHNEFCRNKTDKIINNAGMVFENLGCVDWFALRAHKRLVSKDTG